GFMSIQLSQIIEADKQMFILASNNLMGRLTSSAGAAPALDSEITRLSRSPDIMQYLAPLQNPPTVQQPWKPDGKGGRKGKDKDGKGNKGAARTPLELPQGCVTKDDSNQPLCFAFNTHGCKNQWKKGRLGLETPRQRVRRPLGECCKADLATLFEMLPEREIRRGPRNVKSVFLVMFSPVAAFSPIQLRKGALSRALRQLGFEVHSFDHHHCDAQVPMLQLDLASDSGQAWFWDFLAKHRPFAIHMGVPCGTSSKAVNPCSQPASVSDQNFDDLVQENLTKDPKLISLKRNLAIAKVKQEVARYRDKELQLHNSMHPAVAKVMKGKNVLALESLSQSEGYDDMGAMAFLKEGVRLVGTSECPECFDRKIVPAQLTEGELLETAAERREALLQKFEKVEPREAEALKEATDGEVAHGFLEGPYYDKHGVSAKLGTDQWTIIRRFVLFQGAEQKARPIDNCLESQLNAGYSASIHLRLQDSDYIASMALHVAKAISEGRAHSKAAHWKGKCLDLSKAYKQLAVYPQHRPLAVIAVRGADGRDALYLSNSLMFGSTAAVYAFNRISRCIWFLINRLLWIPAGVFYDDFPLLSPAESSDNADAVVSAFLDELGWLHAKTGAKGKPFAEEFDVLGMSLQLSSFGQGKVVLANKQGRIERIIERMQEIAAKGEIRRHEAQVLQGLLQYASGFYSGRALKHASHVLAKISSGLHFGPKDLSDFCLHTESLLRDESPRILSSSMITDVVHLWTDGAWESGTAGVGVAVHDCFAGMGWVYEGQVPAKVLDKWRTEVGEQLICEIEMFAVLATMLELNTFLSARRVIWWIDNDATRAVIIKGASRSWAMHELARLFSELDSQYPSMWWVCRVPSFSNPGDAPSRGHGSEAMTAVGASKVQQFSMLDELSERLCAFKRASVIRGVGAS
ncbi:unnamed protein product, partial [Symbiodinium necroappetens]